MTLSKIQVLCELVMIDEEFRSQFLKDPQEAVKSKNLDIAPEEVKALLCICESDFAIPKEIPEDLSRPSNCIGALDCEKPQHPAPSPYPPK